MASSQILARAGVDVASSVDFCGSGEEAIEVVRSLYALGGVRYKVVLTDFSMDGMSGIQMTAELRRMLGEEMGIARSEQPFIVGVTGHVGGEIADDAIEQGMDSVLSKPMYLENFQKEMARLKIQI